MWTRRLLKRMRRRPLRRRRRHLRWLRLWRHRLVLRLQQLPAMGGDVPAARPMRAVDVAVAWAVRPTPAAGEVAAPVAGGPRRHAAAGVAAEDAQPAGVPTAEQHPADDEAAADATADE